MTDGWRERLIAERDELSIKVNGLAAFLSKGAPGASDAHRFLLRQQRNAMLDYHDALCDRIALCEREDAAPKTE
jgi:hypothetical protein